MGAAAAVAYIVSAIAAVGGAVYSGVQAEKAEDYNAKVAKRNARAAKEKAGYDEQLHRERVRKLLSNQRALYGKSGVSTVGSPLLVLEETAGQGELDALAIRYGGEVASSRSLSEARAAKNRGKAASTSSYIGAGKSLLSSYGGYQKQFGKKAG